jgi:hypothetical protein
MSRLARPWPEPPPPDTGSAQTRELQVARVPLHRYFLAAKQNEFALGGATAQLRRIDAALASAG